MVSAGGETSAAAAIRARLNERRRRLPASATIRVAASATREVGPAVDSEQDQCLPAQHACLDVLGDGQGGTVVERADEVALEPDAHLLAVPARWRVDGGHWATLCPSGSSVNPA